MHLTSVRPKRRLPKKQRRKIEKLTQRDFVDGNELNGIDDEEEEEAVTAKGLPDVCMPSIEEINAHNLTHVPFRDWCPYCVQGKAVSYPHVKKKKDESDVAVISSDYAGLKHREPEEGQNPIIVMVDRKTKMKYAHVLKSKGAEHYAVERVARELTDGLGYGKFILKDDQEPSIKALREAVIRRVTAIRGAEVQIIPEESPVGESQSNGEVESAIKQVQGHIRTLRLNLQARYQEVLPDKHKIITWLVPHAAQCLNRYLVGVDGKTARQRLKGKVFKTPVVEFGECVWYLKPKSVGKDKLNSRWSTGVWLGIREESGEVYIGTPDGVIKVRTIRRKAGDSLRWDKALLHSVRGLPWEPVPGRDSVEVPISVSVPDEDKVVLPAAENSEKVIVTRDFKIYRSDVKDFGLTPGCKGCLAADAGHPVAKNHSAECRSRMLNEISNKHPQRLIKMSERFLKELSKASEVQPAPASATEVNMEDELPDDIGDEEMIDRFKGHDHVTASSSSQGGPLSNPRPPRDDDEDADMQNAIFSISADEPLSCRPEFAKAKVRSPQHWDTDVKAMNTALAKEGMSVIEAYSPKRVTAMGELMGLIPGMALDLTETDSDG